MKKNDNRGFVLAETLVVTVFLMTIFSMIYYYFYPLIGEYEKREVYDTADDKYSVYWIKRIIEDSNYTITNVDKQNFFRANGYIRFECKDVPDVDQKRAMCESLVKALQVSGCKKGGNMCDIFITPFQLAGLAAKNPNIHRDFKDTVSLPYDKNAGRTNNAILKKHEICSLTDNNDRCGSYFVQNCKNSLYFTTTDSTELCQKLGDERVFNTGFRDYVDLLPDYKNESPNGARYRIIVVFKHTMDNSNYYSYATTEVK